MNRDHYVSLHTTKALHLGTYETAIENMLRRMHDEHDGGVQFYLYRVAIRILPGRINSGYRDENHDGAAQLTIAEIDQDDLDAVRYLNVHEGTGVLSLAVRPNVITAVQRTALPLHEIALPPVPQLLDRDIETLAQARDEMEQAQAKIASIPHSRRRMMYFGVYDDPDGLAKKAGDLEHRYIELWNQLKDRLAESYLPGVSKPIRRDFNEAMASWKSANPTVDADGFVARYRTMAALLERSPEVISYVAAQPSRSLLFPRP
jgi:hypothetical protein